MRKFKLSVILVIAVMVFSTLFVFAEDNIVESKNTRIIIDGKLAELNEESLIIDGKIMLPLRTLLNNLGIQNIGDCIIWNDSERSITINNESTKVFFKLDDTTVYVNGKPVTLDAAAFIYKENERVYIPVKFVAQALGRKVVLDQYSRSVLITYENSYNDVKDILTKVNEAGSNITKLKFKVKRYMFDSCDDLHDYGYGEVDKDEKIVHVYTPMEYDYYYFNNMVYYKNTGYYKNLADNDKWMTSSLSQIQKLYNTLWENNWNATPVVTDILCAGLAVEQGDSNDEIILKGDIYNNFDYLRWSTGVGPISKDKLADSAFEDCHIEIKINKNTNLIKEIFANNTVTNILKYNNVDRYIFSLKSDITYDYTGDFDIQIPEDLKQVINNK